MIILALIVTLDFGLEKSITVEGATITVDGSGLGDHTTIQAAINSATDGDTIYVYSGTYNENVYVDKSISLIGEGKDTTIIDGNRNGSVVRLHNVKGVIISGFSIIKSGSVVYDAGISFDNAQNCLIYENNISGNKKGLWLSDLSLHNTFEGNIISNNLRGFHIQNSNNNIINNIVSSNLGEGIWIIWTSKINIENNYISNNKYGIVIYDSYNINVSNNNFINDGIFITGHKLSHYISHYIPTNNLVNGKPLYYYKNNNGLNINGTQVGQLILANCNNSYLENVKITNTDIGIEIAWSTNTTLVRNEISNNYQRGIFLESSSNNNIIGNKILNNRFGIVLEISSFIFPCSYNNITRNDVLNNSYGIFLVGSSNNSINNNNISTNKVCAIKLWGSVNNNITENIISFNEDGIDARHTKSVNNNIYHNNFIFNANQSFDITNNQNRWDNGYPLGGNYWSDYGGKDHYKGPKQDIPGKDGIGDAHYMIDIDSRDNYPLIEQYKSPEYYMILEEGWTLISIPLIQKEQNLTRVLGSIDGRYDAVQWYNITYRSDHWKHYKIGKPFGNDLFQLNETMSFWIHIINPRDTIFLYNGTKPTSNQTIQLYKGWNMVGYPSLTNHNRTIGLNNLAFGSDIDCIQWFDSSDKSWHFMEENDSFEIGRGYWIHSKVNTTWEVPL
jgi:parallel beta-helix repeat protein